MGNQIVLFNAIDTAGIKGLWITDGTAAGTSELTGINGASAGGLDPGGPGRQGTGAVTVFGNEVLFNGTDAAGHRGLWITNGTAAGTQELTGISGASSNGLDPYGLTVFDGEVIFNGVDAAGDYGLWVTDGTAAGTHEITGINGANPNNGLYPFAFTVFGDKVLFSGASAKSIDLWVTDGTAAGTSALTGVSGMGSFGLNPTNFAVFGSEVVFDGASDQGGYGLWVTDGTATDTHEITGISGVNPSGIGLDPYGFTVFGNQVLFEGYNAAGQFAFWVTNGTAGGTSELTGIAGASSGGLDPTEFTVFGSEVLFNGIDAAGNSGLWVTNGSAAGTHELTGINGASPGGLNPGGSGGQTFQAFTVFGSEVLFDGTDAAGTRGLWVTDGTAAGTHEITGIGGASSSGFIPDPPYMYPDYMAVLTTAAGASITVSTSNGLDLRWATLYNEMANSPIVSGGTATRYTGVDSGQFNGQFGLIEFVFTGTGFTYNGASPNIQLTGGTITGVQETDSSNNVLATFTGLSISAAMFQAAMASYVAGGASPDPTALNTIFLAQAYQVTGGAGSDQLQGGNSSNTFDASTGHDNIAGGTGANTADYSGLITPGLFAIVQGGGGTVNKGGANGSDTLTSVQILIDNGTGRSNGDVFEIDAGENVTASSSNFNYLIELTAGVNLAYGTNFTGISEFVSNVGTNTVSFATDNAFAYLFGSTGNDTLTLGSGGGYLFGEGGANVLTGGANATNLFVGGQGGTDTMNGGAGGASNYYFVDGNDQVNGAGAFNTAIELVSGVTVQLGSAHYQDVQEFVINSGTNAVTVANTDSDFTYLYGGAGNDTLTTGSGGGYLIGEAGTNVLNGGGGTNVFVADDASGVDTMNGGSGSNIYFIDANSTVQGSGTFNTVIELQQNVSLTLGSAQLGSDIQQVVFNGGTNSADFHTAASSVFLYGGSGNDTLFGGIGNDFLYGGTGTNTFTFQSGWGQDTVEDWTAGTNSQIDLTGLAGSGVHAITDLTQTITAGNDVITSSHTGTNSITLLGVGTALTAGSFHFA